jgi:hypothetical protein
MRCEKFPEVDLYCPEGVVWDEHWSESSVAVHEVVMLRRYLPDGISKGAGIKYPKAKLFVFHSHLEKALDKNEGFPSVIRLGIQTFRFAIHTDSFCVLSGKLLRRTSLLQKFSLLFAIGVAVLIWLRDYLNNSVTRTDLEFELNRSSHTISEYTYNWTSD